MRALFLKDAETAPAIQTVEDPAAGAADAVVSLRAAGLNHRELWIAKGQYPGMTLPATLGADGAGVVETVGSDGDQALSGQEVDERLDAAVDRDEQAERGMGKGR